MARLPYVDLADPGIGEALARFREARKRIEHPHRILLHSPVMTEGWVSFFDAIRVGAALAADIRELVILRVAVLTRASYEWDVHVPIALRSGLTQAQVDAVPDWEAADFYDARARAALAYCDAMTNGIQVPDAVFAGVRAAFDERELVELTTTIAAYNMVSRLLEAMEIRSTDPLDPAG